MRFRESNLGRMIHKLPGGEHLLGLGTKLISPYWGLKHKRNSVLALKRNTQEAYAATGIKYTPLSGVWPLLIDYPPDMWFKATFPNRESMKIHLTFERGYQDIDGMAHFALYNQFVTSVLPECGLKPESTAKILDCACGTGYGSNYLQQQLGCQVLGVDLQADVVEYASKRYTPRNSQVSYRQGDATNLSFLPDASLTGVVSIETIEHVPDDAAVVAEFRRALAPGGVMFMSTPDATDRPGTLMSEFHVREYTFSEFKALLEKQFSSVGIIVKNDYLLATCRP